MRYVCGWCARIAVCAYVNFVSNVTHIYSKLVASKNNILS